MKIAIWGASACGKKVIEMLKKTSNWEVVTVADKSYDKQGGIFCDFMVISPEKLIEMVEEKRVDAIVFAMSNCNFKEATSVFRRFDDLRGFVVPRYIQTFYGFYNSSSECLVEIDLKKPRLKQFDVNLVDHCNMKCKGCLRFSNLVDEPVFADFNQMIKDWEKIKELFWGVERLKLMGGEPMLSPDLCEYIKESRRIFPDADIMITTNALLINDNCKQLFQVMKENYCFFDISLYEPMEKKENYLKELLDKNEVWYTINYTKGNFYKVMCTENRYDMTKAYHDCTAKNCHHLRAGKISVCSRPQYIHIMNEMYGTDIPTWDGVWDIYNLDMDAWELDEKLSSPFEACKYCAPPESYEWERANSKVAKMEDWFV